MDTILHTEIQNPDYINFLKTGLSLKELQQGLHPFINKSLQSVHHSLIGRIGGSSCGTCTLDTLLVRHTHCRIRGCVCTRHLRTRRPCPTNTCHLLYDEIVNLHQFWTPVFQNAVFWKIYKDPFEFAKCFLPLSKGYQSKTSTVECDGTALLSIIINCTEVAAMLGARISTALPKDVFTEVRDIRNDVMHSISMEMSEADMKSSLAKMIQVLEHGTVLQSDDDAKKAAKEISKLKDRRFKVTRHMEKDVLEEKFKAVHEKLNDLKDGTSENKEEIAVLEKLQTTLQNKITDVEADIRKLFEVADKHGLKIKSIEEDIVDGQIEMSNMRQKYLGLENRVGDHIEDNKELQRLMGDTNAKLDRHCKKLEEKNLHFKTRLTTDLVEKLTTKKILLLTGKAGIGKKHQAYNILSLLRDQEEYSPVIATNLSEVKSILPNDKPICILVKDVFGRFSLNRDTLEAWSEYIETCVSHAEKGKLMLVVTLDSVQWRQCANEPIDETFSQYLADLETQGLTAPEKDELIQHFDISPNEEMKKTLLNEGKLPLGFPLLCKLAKDKTGDIQSLIEKPLKDIILKMEVSSYMSLLMTMLSGGKFSASAVDEDEGHVPTCFRKLAEHYEEPGIKRSELVSKAKTLVGSYLEKTDEGTFKFMHDSVLEATFRSAVDSDLTHILIKHCHISDLVRLAHHFHEHLTKPTMEALLARFEAETIPVKELAECRLWSDSTFQHEAIGYFKDKLDFFLEQNGKELSLLVEFAGKGLETLVEEVLELSMGHVRIDRSALDKQVSLALLIACVCGQTECVSLLLKQPGKCVYDEHLFLCLHSKNDDLFDFLLEKGGNIEARDPTSGRNLLHEACRRNRPVIIKQMVTKTLDKELVQSMLDMKTSVNGNTPICYAVEQCELETVEFLLQHGSAADIRDKHGNNILHLALLKGADNVIDYLVERYPQMVQEMASERQTVLFYAVLRADLKYIRRFIELEVDPMSRLIGQKTLLHAAALTGNSSVVRYICDNFGELLHQIDKSGLNAAHYACAKGRIDCFQILVDKGISPSSVGLKGQTMLHVTAFYGRLHILEHLCKTYPLLLNKTNVNEWNAAHISAEVGHLDCLKALIKEGINPTCRNSSQATLLHIAAGSGRQDVVKYLCRKFPDMMHQTCKGGWKASDLALSEHHFDCVQIMIDAGLVPTFKQTVHLFATGFFLPAVKFLLRVHNMM